MEEDNQSNRARVIRALNRKNFFSRRRRSLREKNFLLAPLPFKVFLPHVLTSTSGIPSLLSGSKFMGCLEKCKGELFQNS